jgi:methionine aminopeptidase
MKELSDQVLKKYKQCKVVCDVVYKYIKKANKKTLNVMELRLESEKYLQECIEKSREVGIYKVWCPITISINSWKNMWDDKDIIIENGDVIKVEFALTLENVIYWFGDTYIYKTPNIDDNKELIESRQEIIDNLKSISKRLILNVYPEENEYDDDEEVELVNDAIRQYIESECTKFDCYPIENVCSYRDPWDHSGTIRNELMESDMSQIILGFKKKLSDDKEWILVDNPCCEIKDGDVYNLEISIIKDRDSQYSSKNRIYKENEHEYIESESCLYRLDYKSKVMLKTASGRIFFNTIKKEYGDRIFKRDNIVKSVRDKLGFRECISNNLLTEYKTKRVCDSKSSACDNIIYTSRVLIYYKNECLNML